MTKPWYRSKTLWTNAILWAISSGVALYQVISGNTLEIDPAVQGYIVFTVISVVNIILRLITDEGLV